LVVPLDPTSGNIHDLIRRYTTTTTTTATSSGSSKNEDICYLLMTSYSHALSQEEEGEEEKRDRSPKLWIGERFKKTREVEKDDSRQKSILNSANVYFTGEWW